RDRRFDRTVAKAIREGRALDRVTVNRIAGRYGDRLLQLRGEAIARSEMLSALQASKLEAFRQAVDSGQVSRETIKRTWRTAGDGRVRDTHNGMNGQTVLGLDAPFISPSGVRLMHPGDGPAEESINCRCNQEIRIDFLAGVE
ncbi:MAG: phage head morphogenesis protein, partial [Hyphomicrobiales bacterium]|nr:phage head morphogenesis protein [Hyphomicrobiales bacterium]